jgi:hypothetical protein
LHGLRTGQLRSEPVEHFVAADGNLHAAVRTARMRLQVE